ncbi:MAG TPA: DegT/DnrJ/EryC1/StrS family aminotransferase [Tepidiformaceae bacterium]|nr:DegT/DnrJ/EryC1/StrS family aminotransferase [Tepidiformaceae bacterium]
MIPITRPVIGEAEEAAVAEVLRSGWLSQGTRVQAFEAAIADYVGAKHAIATSSCTTALHLALIAAGVQPGDEVVCPSFSFVATANAIHHAGATPVFVDIDPRTYNVDVAKREAAITPRTRAIMPVDQVGLAADIPAVTEIARRHNLAVVEDAAPALGATLPAGRIGSLADFTCFSFHPRKSITTGEGGVITTDNDDAAARLRVLRSHGASTSDLARHHSNPLDFEEYRELGYNYRLTDLQAAVGVVQVGRLESILTERRRLAARYDLLLANAPAVSTPFEPVGYRHTYQSYCIRLAAAAQRPTVMSALAAKGIASRRGVMATHLEPLYRDRYPALVLPETEAAAAETLLLPLFAGMTEPEQDLVVETLLRTLPG